MNVIRQKPNEREEESGKMNGREKDRMSKVRGGRRR